MHSGLLIRGYLGAEGLKVTLICTDSWHLFAFKKKSDAFDITGNCLNIPFGLLQCILYKTDNNPSLILMKCQVCFCKCLKVRTVKTMSY